MATEAKIRVEVEVDVDEGPKGIVMGSWLGIWDCMAQVALGGCIGFLCLASRVACALAGGEVP